MKHVQPPIEFEGSQPSIFLAGGISGCRNWQQRMANLLAGSRLAVLNPRRDEFPLNDPDAGRQQITWEFQHLRQATARLFWFPPETLCPIALFELGGWMKTREPLFVGMHPNYARRFDLEMQLHLARPDVSPVYELRELAEQVLAWEAAQ